MVRFDVVLVSKRVFYVRRNETHQVFELNDVLLTSFLIIAKTFKAVDILNCCTFSMKRAQVSFKHFRVLEISS